MARKKQKEQLFCDYYDEWIETYKVGAIADVTLNKYYHNAKLLRDICPKLLISDFDRKDYQRIINEYAKTHEKQTTVDFPKYKTHFTELHIPDEVEEEQLYQVIINGDYLIKLFDNRNDHKFVDKEDLVIWLPSGYQLTEAEIKAIDERYWPFAVPVEKVEV